MRKPKYEPPRLISLNPQQDEAQGTCATGSVFSTGTCSDGGQAGGNCLQGAWAGQTKTCITGQGASGGWGCRAGNSASGGISCQKGTNATGAGHFSCFAGDGPH
jgi:hypothetical protein